MFVVTNIVLKNRRFTGFRLRTFHTNQKRRAQKILLSFRIIE